MKMADQPFCIGAVCTLPEQKRDFLRLAWLKPEQQLQSRTRVTPCMYTWRETHTFQRRRITVTSMTAQKLRAICSDAIRFTRRRQECNTLPKICAVSVARQQSEMTRHKFRDNIRSCVFAPCAKHPFGIIGNVDATHTICGVMKF